MNGRERDQDDLIDYEEFDEDIDDLMSDLGNGIINELDFDPEILELARRNEMPLDSGEWEVLYGQPDATLELDEEPGEELEEDSDRAGNGSGVEEGAQYLGENAVPTTSDSPTGETG